MSVAPKPPAAPHPSDAPRRSAVLTPRRRALALCSGVVAALVAVAVFVPLPFTLTFPGVTADALSDYDGHQVVTITGAPVRQTSGALRVLTITATDPNVSISLNQAIRGWLNPRVAVLPRDSVYPQSNATKAEQVTTQEMTQAQDSATTVALNYLHLSPDQVKVKVDLGSIGGPSGGQMISLAIIDKLAGDGKGGDLTHGLNVAGTGTIDDSGNIGAVGGVSLKTLAAARDGATVFLVPRGECSDARVNTPRGLRLIPVTTLSDSLNALAALGNGAPVPSC
ncbi:MULTISPECIES: S16 family serine protease [unclassified Kitasatospora]|uniref:S16 family serine protease n=1 Tax=unclassified Kitasatospora TaxID=2633591 RepID=UPI0032B01CB9